jgi:hypothetical protein
VSDAPWFGELAVGRRLLDRFELLAELGRGGFSVVYAARDHAVGNEVAIKVLVPPPAAAREAKERMRREVNAIRGLRHPNLVGVHDFLEDGPIAFVVMDLIDGEDLAARIRSRGPLAPEQTVALGRAIADALSAAHSAGILHRDIKPANILLDRSGKAYLTDFGSARLETQTTMTRTGGWVGTMAYLAPEVWLGDRPDARADVFALGTTLYESLTGRLPDRPSAHLPPTPEGDGFRPARVNPAVPLWLDQAIGDATTADPRYRLVTAGALRDALERKAVPGPAILRDSSVTTPANAALPASFRLLLGGVVLSGTFAGIAVTPWFFVSGVAVAGLLHRSARRAVQRAPAAASGARPSIGPAFSGLPLAAVRRLETIPAGTARTLVEDVLSLAQAHQSQATTPTLAARRRDELRPLVVSAIDAGHELAQVDDALRRMERDQQGAAEIPAGWWDGMASLERARSALSSVLLDLIATLGRARGVSVDDFDAARLRLEERLGEFREDLSRTALATAELRS